MRPALVHGKADSGDGHEQQGQEDPGPAAGRGNAQAGQPHSGRCGDEVTKVNISYGAARQRDMFIGIAIIVMANTVRSQRGGVDGGRTRINRHCVRTIRQSGEAVSPVSR